MQGLIRCGVIAGLLVGCGAGGIGPQDDTQHDDADVGPSGLIIHWSSAPSDWPSTVNGVTLERARFAVESLRVVGDAGPGDMRTTATTLEMGFDWTSDGQRPEDITFDDAPTGRYSQVAIVFDHTSGSGPDDSYEIRGTVDVNSQNWDFRIQDANPLPFNVAIDEMVTPGEVATINLRINFTHALDSVNWSSISPSDGRLEIDESDSMITVFRQKLIESFEVVSAGSGSAR
jgi:hypothetical protein